MLWKEQQEANVRGVKMIRVFHVKFYTCFASAILNGDYSGLTEDGAKEVEIFFEKIMAHFGDGAEVVDVMDDDEFTWKTSRDEPRLFLNDLPGDVSKYVVHTYPDIEPEDEEIDYI